MTTESNFYADRQLLFGDLHNHCGLSYGHGSLEDALKNAREQLDFCSITGHAHWPDMPEPDERIQYIIDFHNEGFAKLKRNWPKMMDTLKTYDQEGSFTVFPGFEIHSNADGDRTIIYKRLSGEVIYANSIPDLHQRLLGLEKEGVDALAFAHHIGYRRGTRGINWETFDSKWSPFVEIISMHGCSESSENTRPFLHSMGGSDWESSVQYGLQQGHIFGFSGHTDHHSGHPGSYGHGVTGIWSKGNDRDSIWDALKERRLYALTGDRIHLEFSLNGEPMGSVLEQRGPSVFDIRVKGAGPLDYVDIVKNGRLAHRSSQVDFRNSRRNGDTIHTFIYLELGWGERNKAVPWNVKLGVDSGSIKRVEPRFRGLEVVSPVEGDDSDSGFYESTWIREDDRNISFKTVTRSNPNNATNASQGMCLEVVLPSSGTVQAEINGQSVSMPLSRLIEGARTGHLGGIDSPAYRFHRAPLPHEFDWNIQWNNDVAAPGDTYYVRVRQLNDQWAWSSPIFFR